LPGRKKTRIKRIPKGSAWIVRAVLALIALHCLLIGWSGWWTPATWPGCLPPITLLSFLFAMGTLCSVCAFVSPKPNRYGSLTLVAFAPSSKRFSLAGERVFSGAKE